MKHRWKGIYFEMRIRLRLLRLKFVRVRRPPDAKSPEEMLEEIKKKSKFT
ncbi:hypothetical protein [Lachnoclostridium sp. An196]|nr:hypothetical protein [Lachnoclostridium sp. An196]